MTKHTNKKKEMLQRQRKRRADIISELRENPPADGIPNKTELAKKYGVSRATIGKDLNYINALKIKADAQAGIKETKKGYEGEKRAMTREEINDELTEEMMEKATAAEKNLKITRTNWIEKNNIWAGKKAEINHELRQQVESIWVVKTHLERENKALKEEVRVKELSIQQLRKLTAAQNNRVDNLGEDIKTLTKERDFWKQCNINQSNVIQELQTDKAMLSELLKETGTNSVIEENQRLKEDIRREENLFHDEIKKSYALRLENEQRKSTIFRMQAALNQAILSTSARTPSEVFGADTTLPIVLIFRKKNDNKQTKDESKPI